MRDVKIRTYQKKLSYSFAFGLFPCLELVKYKPTKTIKVLFKMRADEYKETKNIKEICDKNGIKYEYNDRLIDKVATKENTYAVGVFEKYEDTLEQQENHLVLINPSDHGNVGTIIRSMQAFNYKNLCIVRPGADVFDPKVVSTTMGYIFRTRIKYFDSFQEYRDLYDKQKLHLFTLDGNSKLNEVKFEKPYTLVFGNEGTGVPNELKVLGNTVFIEQSREVDSLNLAISVSIALYKTFSPEK